LDPLVLCLQPTALARKEGRRKLYRKGRKSEEEQRCKMSEEKNKKAKEKYEK